METDPAGQFTADTLADLYAAISAPEGVMLAELGALVKAFSTHDVAQADVQAYREGRKPWKKLHDEIVPVAHFLSSGYPAGARVRFPLDDQPPDAWLSVGDAAPVGIEVTGALARASVEVGKSMAAGGLVPGFIALQDDASSAAFAQATARRRATHSRVGIERMIDQAIAVRLAGKNHEKYEGHILLITAPTGSSPYRSSDELRGKLAPKAADLPFAQVFVVDAARGKPPIRLK